MTFTPEFSKKCRDYFKKVYFIYGDHFIRWNWDHEYADPPPNTGGQSWKTWLDTNSYLEYDTTPKKFTQKFIDEVVNDENKHTSYSSNGFVEGVYLYFDGDVWKFTEKFFRELEKDV